MLCYMYPQSHQFLLPTCYQTAHQIILLPKMAFCNPPTLLHSSSSRPQFHSNSNHILLRRMPRRFLTISMAKNSTTPNADNDPKPTKFVTFLGKGGSGKTFSAIFAAQVPFLTYSLCIFSKSWGERSNSCSIDWWISIDLNWDLGQLGNYVKQ